MRIKYDPKAKRETKQEKIKRQHGAAKRWRANNQ